jgi:hypothetical protein
MREVEIRRQTSPLKRVKVTFKSKGSYEERKGLVSKYEHGSFCSQMDPIVCQRWAEALIERETRLDLLLKALSISIESDGHRGFARLSYQFAPTSRRWADQSARPIESVYSLAEGIEAANHRPCLREVLRGYMPMFSHGRQEHHISSSSSLS